MFALVIGLIIYFVGFIASYVMCKMVLSDEDDTWDDVGQRVKLSFFSWITFVFMTVAYFAIRHADRINKRPKQEPKEPKAPSKPPRWL